MTGKESCGCLSHETDAESEDHTFERHALGCCYAIDNFLCRLGARAVAIDLLNLDLVEVCDVLDKSLTIVVVDGLRTQRVDVHRLTGYEMFDTTFDLWRTTGIVRTIPCCLALISHQRSATLRTAFDELYRLCDDRTLVDIHTDYLWDNLTTFLYIYVVAYMEVEALDEILVVEGGSFYDGTSQLDRIHICHRGDGSSTTYLIGHLIKTGAYSLCLELICDGPARTLCREAKRALLAKGVDL